VLSDSKGPGLPPGLFLLKVEDANPRRVPAFTMP